MVTLNAFESKLEPFPDMRDSVLWYPDIPNYTLFLTDNSFKVQTDFEERF